LGEVL
jgi:hypothetical protein